MALSFVEGYDALTNDELEERLETTVFTVAQLEQMHEYEETHEDRLGAKRAITDAKEALEPVPDVTGAAPHRDVDPSAGASDAPEQVILLPAGSRQYVAGEWYDDPAEPKRVDYTPRVEQALANGVAELDTDV